MSKYAPKTSSTSKRKEPSSSKSSPKPPPMVKVPTPPAPVFKPPTPVVFKAPPPTPTSVALESLKQAAPTVIKAPAPAVPSVKAQVVPIVSKTPAPTPTSLALESLKLTVPVTIKTPAPAIPSVTTQAGPFIVKTPTPGDLASKSLGLEVPGVKTLAPATPVAKTPTLNSQAKEELDKKARKIVQEFEGSKLNKEGKHQVYDDGTGVATIGPGFALIIKVGGEWQAREHDKLKELGINLTDKQYKVIEQCAKDKSREGKLSDKTNSDLKNMSLTIDNETAQRLFDHTTEDSQGKIKERIGEEAWNKLGHAQQVAVTDYCYHHGNISPIAKFLKGEEKTIVRL